MAPDLKSAVRKLASDLGFDSCGFTTPSPPETTDRFLCWLANGCHATMSYLQKTAQKRCRPIEILPGTKTIIALAASYADRNEPVTTHKTTPNPGGSSPGSHLQPVGVVARYARFRDYHLVLREKLAALAEHINRLGGPGTRSVGYVDTGPILERDLAQRAGIGFFGKHNNLISRKLGNWFFLAEIFTTLELEPDPPDRNRCGVCMRCVLACPTRALIKPFHLDARRCVSYLTIELRGAIPVDLRPLIGNRVFGCDACLEVCPWNKFASAPKLMAQYKWTNDGQLNLIELLNLNQCQFNHRFGDTPIARAKFTGLIRNACVAIGNVGGPDAIPTLQKLAAANDAIIADHAQWALNQIRQRWNAKA